MLKIIKKIMPKKIWQILRKVKKIGLFKEYYSRNKRIILNWYLKNKSIFPTKKEQKLINDLRNKIKSLRHLPKTKNDPNIKEEWLVSLIKVRKNILKKDPRFFLNWEEISHTMFHNAEKTELDYLKKQHDWNKWKKALEESKIGNPKPYKEMPNSSGNLIHHAYNLSQLLDTHYIDINEINHIFEFGGGYGSSARLIHQLGYKGSYTIYDLPEFDFFKNIS